MLCLASWLAADAQAAAAVQAQAAVYKVDVASCEDVAAGGYCGHAEAEKICCNSCKGAADTLVGKKPDYCDECVLECCYRCTDGTLGRNCPCVDTCPGDP